MLERGFGRRAKKTRREKNFENESIEIMTEESS
jgi:hypothetical protein